MCMSSRAPSKPLVNASPAPTVSTSVMTGAARCTGRVWSVYAVAPCAPWVTTTSAAPSVEPVGSDGRGRLVRIEPAEVLVAGLDHVCGGDVAFDERLAAFRCPEQPGPHVRVVAEDDLDPRREPAAPKSRSDRRPGASTTRGNRYAGSSSDRAGGLVPRPTTANRRWRRGRSRRRLALPRPTRRRPAWSARLQPPMPAGRRDSARRAAATPGQTCRRTAEPSCRRRDPAGRDPPRR